MMKYLVNILFSVAWSLNLAGQPIDLEKDLVANYLFSGNAQDATLYANHGIVNGPVLTQDRFGNDDSAFSFDGTNDYIQVPDADILSFTHKKMSIALWIKPGLHRHSYMLYKGSTPTNREYAVGMRVDGTAVAHVNDQYDPTIPFNVGSKTVTNLDEWYHLVMTWDGSKLCYYVNGVFESRLEYVVSVGNFNSDLFIGSYGGDISTYAFSGIIDDIFIYKRVINDCEIEALYTGQDSIER